MSSKGTTSEGNRLARETSPYLLQHAHNPVDWYPWGSEALERARAENRPIFLSVGYSACHWCHVMERESFENAQIAELMNAHFVNVKVDREERPDLDEIYMKATQHMTGSGGWPMSVFLTPKLEPFFAGTYFPPYSILGRRGFADIVASLARAWEENAQRLSDQAQRMTEVIAREGRADTRGSVDPAVLDASLAALRESFDPVWGGFGDAPKFPHSMDLRVLLRHGRRTGDPDALKMASFSLDKMARGGIYDQLGGGFHRYSTDDEWLIPHFEKMLYDNALLVPAYLEASLALEDEGDTWGFERVARETCDWMLREMQTPEGAFASSQDADTEGEEGRYFTWTPEELIGVLGARRAGQAQEWFGVTPEGNFEHGTSALTRRDEARAVAARLSVPEDDLLRSMAEARDELRLARERRVRPGLDDKVLVAWNGLAISALAQAAQVLEEPRYLAAAQGAARYLIEHLLREDGRLFATARAGRAQHEGCLDDYAFLIQGLLDLYESDFEADWLHTARNLAQVLEDDFLDPDHGGYFSTGRRHEPLIARLKNPHDGALPAGAAVHATSLLRLAELTGTRAFAERAERTLLSMGSLVNRYPHAFSSLLCAIDFLAAPPREVVIAGAPGAADTRAMLRAVRRTFAPARVVALAGEGVDETLLPLVEGRTPGPHGARAYLCVGYSCREPLDDAVSLARALREQ